MDAWKEKWDHNKDIHRNNNGNDKRGGDGGDDVCGGKANRPNWRNWKS